MISISNEWFSVENLTVFQWLCLTFFLLEFSMPRRHLCDLLLVPLELKRLGDECSLFLSKNCLKQHQFFVSFCWDWSCNWILSINEILHVLSASHIFSHFSWWTKSWHCLRLVYDRSWKSSTIRSLPPWISWWVLSARETQRRHHPRSREIFEQENRLWLWQRPAILRHTHEKHYQNGYETYKWKPFVLYFGLWILQKEVLSNPKMNVWGGSRCIISITVYTLSWHIDYMQYTYILTFYSIQILKDIRNMQICKYTVYTCMYLPEASRPSHRHKSCKPGGNGYCNGGNLLM